MASSYHKPQGDAFYALHHEAGGHMGDFAYSPNIRDDASECPEDGHVRPLAIMQHQVAHLFATRQASHPGESDKALRLSSHSSWLLPQLTFLCANISSAMVRGGPLSAEDRADMTHASSLGRGLADDQVSDARQHT